jgi:myo-inositol-1(or 4)-monophosphatase
MQTNRLPLGDYLDAAVCSAHAAAAILQAYAGNRGELVIDTKARNDLVSQADREAEQAIVDILLERTPELGIVAEESGRKPHRNIQATWYIDPLDGTTNFLHGIPHYAVSIALVAHAGTCVSSSTPLAHDTPVVGVVYDPCREELFTAIHEVGA